MKRFRWPSTGKKLSSPPKLDYGEQLFAAQLSQEQLPREQVAFSVEHLQEAVQAVTMTRW